MINKSIDWNEYPFNVKMAILFLVTGWLLHLMFYFIYLMTDQWTRNDYLMIGVGLAICFFVASINKWARSLCIFFNLGIIAIYVVLLFFGKAGIDRYVFETMVVFSFGLSTFFLVQKETATFFKTHRQPSQAEDSAENT